MKQKKYMMAAALLALALAGCRNTENFEVFDNKLYIDATAKTKDILLVGRATDEASFNIAMPKTEEKAVKATVAADPSLVKTYNEAYYDSAILLPEGYYTIASPEVTINPGSVRSGNIGVSFAKLTELSRDQRYVLPVTVSSADVSVLPSARTIYYVVRSGALINVVGDIDHNELHTDNWPHPADLNALNSFTAEALIRARSFDHLISTVMGVEDAFLIRIGDAGIPQNQLQIATANRAKYTSSDLIIPTNVWVHIAVTYDAVTHELTVYINGRNKLRANTGTITPIDWGNRDFWIGHSFDSNRFLTGNISECRVWNKALTSDEINSPNHFYFVDPASEGLVAYWKFNEGGGSVVTDYSKNGNNLTATNPLQWTGVSLPAQ